jgi:hypothetical protein
LKQLIDRILAFLHLVVNSNYAGQKKGRWATRIGSGLSESTRGAGGLAPANACATVVAQESDEPFTWA